MKLSLHQWIIGFSILLSSFPLLFAQTTLFEQTSGYRGGELFDFTIRNNTLYAISLEGVIRSEDAGNNWQLVLDLPLDEAYYDNTLRNQLVANDSIIFVFYRDYSNNAITPFFKQSTDNGTSWSAIMLPEDIHINNMDINNRYLYINNGKYYADLQAPILSFQEEEEPALTGKHRFYQGDYTFIYNFDSLYFSNDNINWIYKPMPITTPCGSGINLTTIGQDLYIVIRCNLFKTTLTADTTYIALETDFLSRRIASYDYYLYYKKANKLLEINTITDDTFQIQGSTFDFFDKMLFTNEYAFVKRDGLDIPSIIDIDYQPIVRFHRFSNIQPSGIDIIRSSLDRENSYKLVVINNELFCCNVQGLHRYNEEENEWSFVETPFFQVTDISWNEGYYYLANRASVYRTSSFEDWEAMYLENGALRYMLPYNETMLFFGIAYLTAYNETNGVWTINETANMGNGGTYSGLGSIFPPVVCNDTLVMMGYEGLLYSADTGHTWEHFNNTIQSHYGFPNGDNVYYFKRYLSSTNLAHISFVKKNKHAPISSDDYITIYNDTYYGSEPSFYFYFLKSNELLFFSIPNVGILYSNDDGLTWQMLNNDIFSLQVNSIAATNDYIYFASKQHGVRRLKKDVITTDAEIIPNPALNIFPNPAKNLLQFSNLQSGEIYDLTGRAVLQFNYQQNIDISQLQTGLYFIKFEDKYHSIRTFVKQ